MTPEQIAELRAALAKATPGPWRTFAGINDDGVWAACGPEHEADYDADETNEPGDRAEQAAQRDAELIALMRTALPALLDAAERCAKLANDVEEMLCHVPGDMLEGDGDTPADAIQRLAAKLAEVEQESDAAIARAERAEEALRKLADAAETRPTS